MQIQLARKLHTKPTYASVWYIQLVLQNAFACTLPTASKTHIMVNFNKLHLTCPTPRRCCAMFVALRLMCSTFHTSDLLHVIIDRSSVTLFTQQNKVMPHHQLQRDWQKLSSCCSCSTSSCSFTTARRSSFGTF